MGKTYSPQAIRWVDSSRIPTGWSDVRELSNVGFKEITTVGFVVDEDDEKVVISHTMSINGPAVFTYDAFIIPKGCIVKRSDLVRDEIDYEVEDDSDSENDK